MYRILIIEDDFDISELLQSWLTEAGYQTAEAEDGLNTAMRGDLMLELTNREFECLRELLQNQGRVMTYQMLVSRIWNYDYLGDDRVIYSHIKNLRRKLGADYIRTVRGVGYRVDKD